MKVLVALATLTCAALVGATGVLHAVSQPGKTPAAATRLRSVVIKDVPHIRQKPDFCGEACAAMYLQKLGVRSDQDAVFDASGLDPALGRGCYTRSCERR